MPISLLFCTGLGSKASTTIYDFQDCIDFSYCRRFTIVPTEAQHESIDSLVIETSIPVSISNQSTQINSKSNHDPQPLPTTAAATTIDSMGHLMVTRSQAGITKPNPKYCSSDYAYLVNTIPTEPKTVKSALKHPGWLAAMNKEIDALHQNGTWDLVIQTSTMNVVSCKWVYKAKLKSDGSLDRLKAWLVAKGFTQQPAIDFQETFSPIIKPATIRVVLTIALAHDWDIRQLDVKNAFLHGYLSDLVHMDGATTGISRSISALICLHT